MLHVRRQRRASLRERTPHSGTTLPLSQGAERRPCSPPSPCTERRLGVLVRAYSCLDASDAQSSEPTKKRCVAKDPPEFAPQDRSGARVPIEINVFRIADASKEEAEVHAPFEPK